MPGTAVRFMSSLLGALALMLATTPAQQARAASLKVQQSRTYYTIDGSSERAMLLDMRRKGPRISGRPALAATHMQTNYHASLRRRGGRCRVEKFDMSARFTMRLPRLRREGRLRAGTRKRWRSFQHMLVRHENRHIRIWTGCLRQVRAQLPRLTARDCVSLKRRLKQRYHAIMAGCRRQHEAFDRRERHAAPKVPFIRAAFATPRRQAAQSRQAHPARAATRRAAGKRYKRYVMGRYHATRK